MTGGAGLLPDGEALAAGASFDVRPWRVPVCVAVGLLVRRSVFLRQASGSRRAHGPALAHVVRLGALMAGLLIILAAVPTDSFASRSQSTTPASVAANPLAIQSSKSLTPLIILPSNKACVAGGKLTIQFDSTPHGPWAKVTIYLNGKRLKTLKRPHITRLVTITGLPRGSFLIAVTGITRAGRARAVNRHYRACPPKTSRTLSVGLAGTGSGRVTGSGISCPGICSDSYPAGTTVTLTGAAGSGSSFAGWSGGGCSGTGTCTVTMSSDRSVTATFATNPPPSYTLTVALAGTGSGSVTGSGISCPGICSDSYPAGTMVTLTGAAGSGSSFAGWSGGGCSGTGTCTVTMSSDQSVTATFATNGTGTAVAAGYTHTCAVLSTGHVECWGQGPLGNGSNGSSYTPVEVSGITDATQVSAGYGDACALLSTGHVECWGDGQYGELGNGSTTTAYTPVEVSGIADATQVTTGQFDTCALLSTGHVECWGINGEGELGNGKTTESDTPVEVSGITDATEVSTGYDHTCALLSTGHVDCWGFNNWGQLGNGQHGTEALTPVEVSGITDATEVTAGYYDELNGNYTCALLSTGHVECWGYNIYGELGNGTTTYSDTPVEVSGITDATQVSAGAGQTCALLSTGHIDCWGPNGLGQLGDGGTTTYSDTPVEVSGITDATQVAAGYLHTCALLSTGDIECWGFNGYGQLGNGRTGTTSYDSDTPVEVSGI
jgi:alpha-tubulin suppressor-like RCC1 family protein